MSSRIYLASALVLLFMTTATCAYIEGHIAGAVHQKNAHESLLEREENRGDYYKAKYEALADETDGITVIAAEMKLQQQAGAGQ